MSTYLERWKAPISAVTLAGIWCMFPDFRHFDPETGEVVANVAIERQTELIMEQMKLCLETAGSDLDHILQCNVYCTSVDYFPAVNKVYAGYFKNDPPARIFVNVPAWPGTFNIEIDCVAVVKDAG